MVRKLDIDRYAIGQINMLANRLITNFSEAYQIRFGVGIMEWRVIAILYDHPNSSLQYISDIVGLDKAAVSRSLKKLSEKKIVLIKEDKLDKRAYKLKLSKKGEILYTEISEFSL
ncbi:MarR family winged helix-turn-helix transcriptional regulator, partial [Acinetobacter oleivorans]|uniref:MarR family winged helix-turn-helix transcriptional regulator n=2 Tax=Acinetobacter TaxID=469 RepID=UPI0015811543